MKSGKAKLIICFYIFNFLVVPVMVINSQAPNQRVVIQGREFIMHVVRQGEGLYGISNIYGLTVEDILEANNDISTNLKVGQILRIPVVAKSQGATVTIPSRHIRHVVEGGQTLFSISRMYGVPVDEIHRLNPAAREGLRPGDVLQIPSVNEPGATKPGQGNIVSAGNGIVVHVVQPRETLFGISRQYNVSVESILNLNPGLRDGVLGAGDRIKIPVSGNIPGAISESSSMPHKPGGGNNEFISHTVARGETLFSISRQNQVSLHALLEANPGIEEGNLAVGTVLRVPRGDLALVGNNQGGTANGSFISHRVRRKETLFGIARHYNVEMDIIRQLNPGVNFNQLQNGTILRIPTSVWVDQQRVNQVPAVAETEDAMHGNVNGITRADCLREHELGRSKPVRVAIMLPFGANRLTTQPAATDTLTLLAGTRQAEGRSKDFVEFYGGVLLALDTLKKRGVSVELSVFDIAQPNNVEQLIASNPTIRDAHLIIGPAFSQELPAISTFSRNNKIPLVFPLSNTNPGLSQNPYLFHVNTPDSLVLDQVVANVTRMAAGKNLVVILPPAGELQANRMAIKLRQSVAHQNKGGGDTQFAEYRPSGDDLAHVQALLSRERDNLVVVPSVNSAEVSRVIPIIYGAKVNTGANVNLVGMSDWLRSPTIEPEHVHALNTTIFTAFALDYNRPVTRLFIQKYRDWFNTEPHAVSPYFHRSDSSSGFSRYGIWGFDVAHYFISALVEFGEDFYLCLHRFNHEQVQFNFDFQRISSNGGYFNRGLHKLYFRPDFRVERVPLE